MNTQNPKTDVNVGCTFPNIQSFNWGTGVNFISCVGSFQGNNNDNLQSIQQLTSAWGGSWNSLGSSDAGKIDNPFQTFSAASVGTLYFTTPISGKFVLGLKASDSYTYYLLEAPSPVSSVNYNTAGTALNKQGFAQEISHVNLYVPQTTVPEPMTFALMALGLLSVFVIKKFGFKKT